VTAPAPSGSSPLRVGGLVLIGVGVVAGIIGLGTVATGSGAAPAAAASVTSTATPEPGPPAPAATTATPAPAPAPTSDAAVPVPSFGPTPTNGIAAPPTSAAPPAPAPAPAPADGSFTKAPVRVYNNSTIHGLAARAADDFRASGWPVEHVANYPSGIIPTSTVYYRPGTNEQAAAAALGGQFGMRVEPRFAGLTEASPGLIVIVTNDYQH
jgi:hypothetical protein